MTQIPDELVSLTRERRVIPFVGAGFSASVGLPDWSLLLRKLADEIDNCLPFDELHTLANGDFLQIAEYMYLKSDRRIGPLRHIIEQQVAAARNTISSGPHVELANLRARQIYTTNYDDLIERTYRGLGLDFSTVALPRDVALADTDRPQIVKYHGDLRHEQTLVLTESHYYRRLDLESPMDLKFRSDLLGKSVLFMGYSFRDINIRLIWFKLMEMMRDIAPGDRRMSYILRLSRNPVLEELYAAVGLQTIVIEGDGTAQQGEVLSNFLYDLANRASSTDASGGPMFVSETLLRRSTEVFARAEVGSPYDEFRMFVGPGDLFPDGIVDRLSTREVPAELRTAFADVLRTALPRVTPTRFGGRSPTLGGIRLLTRSIELELTEATDFIARWLMDETGRSALVRVEGIPWQWIWQNQVQHDTIGEILRRTRNEIGHHMRRRGGDDDLAYCLDLIKRITDGSLATELDESQEEAVELVLNEMRGLYPELADAIATHQPSIDTFPQPSAFLSAFEEHRNASTEGTSGDDNR